MLQKDQNKKPREKQQEKLWPKLELSETNLGIQELV